MKLKSVIISIITLALILIVSVVVSRFFRPNSLAFDKRDTPSINITNINKLSIYKGRVRHRDSKPVLILDGQSEDTIKIILVINKGYRSHKMISLTNNGYSVDIEQTDGTHKFAYACGKLITISNPNGSGAIYRTDKDLQSVIAKIIKK